VQDVLIVGVPAVVVIIALIELLKVYGLATRWAPVVALGLGVIISVGNELVAIYPLVEPWYNALWVGLLLGLVACGLYDVGSKTVLNRKGSG